MRNRHVTDVRRPAGATLLETLEARECFSAATPFVPVFPGGVRVAGGDVNDATAGVNVAMGDGSVRFTVDGVSPGGFYRGGVYVGGGNYSGSFG